ncbi:hypothetical protein QYE76_037305 [Lolium multiflorum]|uniref:Uncharacterized protein n=1 Tax=Lolium multiflorum TaxID=4521 RepID=A0AAD8QIT1_LOLMU|nr:hypothetical protein QYE76_037305 [Lolium multiflorum]
MLVRVIKWISWTCKATRLTSRGQSHTKRLNTLLGRDSLRNSETDRTGKSVPSSDPGFTSAFIIWSHNNSTGTSPNRKLGFQTGNLPSLVSRRSDRATDGLCEECFFKGGMARTEVSMIAKLPTLDPTGSGDGNKEAVDYLLTVEYKPFDRQVHDTFSPEQMKKYNEAADFFDELRKMLAESQKELRAEHGYIVDS